MIIGTEIYDQIVSTWRFMHIGLAIDSLMCKSIKPKVPTFTSRGYRFKSNIIKNFWPQVENNSTETYFGSHIFYFSAREIFSGIVEGLKANQDEIFPFPTFIKDKLGDQYDDFDILIRFCRNVLSHNVTAKLQLLPNDFNRQKAYLKKERESLQISLNIKYSQIFSPDYPFQDHFIIAFDFDNVTEDKTLHQFISPIQLMQLLILSGSLAESYINELGQKSL